MRRGFTVKAVTIIFISGRGSAISSAKQGKSGSIYTLVKNKIISHYKEIGYNTNVLQQTACLVVNPMTVGNFAFLFNCTPVGRTSDFMMVRLKDLSIDGWVGA